jgi:hypothetical protein
LLQSYRLHRGHAFGTFTRDHHACPHFPHRTCPRNANGLTPAIPRFSSVWFNTSTLIRFIMLLIIINRIQTTRENGKALAAWEPRRMPPRNRETEVVYTGRAYTFTSMAGYTHPPTRLDQARRPVGYPPLSTSTISDSVISESDYA